MGESKNLIAMPSVKQFKGIHDDSNFLIEMVNEYSKYQYTTVINSKFPEECPTIKPNQIVSGAVDAYIDSLDAHIDSPLVYEATKVILRSIKEEIQKYTKMLLASNTNDVRRYIDRKNGKFLNEFSNDVKNLILQLYETDNITYKSIFH